MVREAWQATVGRVTRVGHDLATTPPPPHINNDVTVSGGQQRDPAIHIHVFILPQTPLPSRLPHNIEQSSMCYIVGPCWLSILNISVCTCPSQTP